ncbi:sigma-54 interaction domain-containing protein [Flammeovirga kamogawensis]|uniref:Sigma-54 dependent transcriptional regulator n=1 Tax=Flammeovirga kamogawensis TaxID=373891 RepID=A0ABX8GX77_9BACT|nr:sigma-54 dependent transcriptional regulator [Flammeovirga kamogawensis]MBB6460788.1 DNA-binding NtrC family response regulator [Flammeovirga kamogawensis]QWG08141.1 sigma-54 dependent transcriptional regulator [Flammeovirga kamogawensis]TRX69944.1 sigma-54-dependent Fis family transcriptional regulator [Flammeovirga kamogawensis]
MQLGILSPTYQFSQIILESTTSKEDVIKYYSSFSDFIASDFIPNILFIDDALIVFETIKKEIRSVRKKSSEVKLVAISESNDIDYADALEEIGFNAFLLNNDFFIKRLKKCLNSMRHNFFQLNASTEINDIIKGDSEEIKKVFEIIKKASTTKINVNITGETGTGKELVAQAIHKQSTRNQNPFIAVNIAAIPKDLIESELFGHEEGAFTGATKRRLGKFEEAKHGTLFLDEIGELSLDLQTKLLRVLQENEVTRIGSNEVIKTDIRLVTATHKNLRNEVFENKFREDLYYRLLGLPLKIPPLRERKGDIIKLAELFIEEACNYNKITPIKKLHADAQRKLLSYHFPGNVRQLKSLIELSVIISDYTTIKAGDLLIENEEIEDISLKKERTLEEYNIEIIEYFLKKYKGKVNFVSDKLDMSKSKIYKLIQEKKLSKY